MFLAKLPLNNESFSTTLMSSVTHMGHNGNQTRIQWTYSLELFFTV